MQGPYLGQNSYRGAGPRLLVCAIRQWPATENGTIAYLVVLLPPTIRSQ
jgi:hypothetical protein